MSGRTLNVVLLVFLSLIWGLGYTCIQLADETIPPITMMAIRSLLATATLISACVILRRPLRQCSFWHPAYLAPALLITTFPWALTAEGEDYIDAGLTSVMTAITPMSTFVISALILRIDHANWVRLLGLVIGLVGLAVTIGIEHLLQAHVSFLGLACVSAAYIMYGINGVLLARWGRGLDPLVTCTYGIGYGSVLLTLGAFLFESPFAIHPRMEDVGALLLLGIVITAGGYGIFFYLVDRAGALFASSWGYLVPVFGVIISAILLGTPLGWQRMLGTALVIAGVVLVNLKGTTPAK